MDDLLDSLAILPDKITTKDRLFVNTTSGCIEIDKTYAWAGTMDRMLMNHMYDGYNRDKVVHYYERILVRTQRYILTCEAFFKTPRVIGNFKMFGILPNDYSNSKRHTLASNTNIHAHWCFTRGIPIRCINMSPNRKIKSQL